MQQGHISVQTENIFPIIKRFLYSDQEIFLRELVSNAVDATSKMRTLHNKGAFSGELGELRIDIHLDKEAKTLTISDRGIGMTADEVIRYLNQVAFSSAQEFVEKYQAENSIIGHFGLGFYSAFMVASKVEVRTQSWQGGPAMLWTCDGNPSYTLEETTREGRGTDVILHISEDADEFLDKYRIEELLKKYCRFLPVPIYFGTRTEYLPDTDEDTTDTDDTKEPKTIEVENQINITTPIWKRSPAELTDQDYLDFYRELHPLSADPMFWIHLNIDHPFNLTGVLYFPKLKNGMEVQQNKIQLYSNQVFVTDNVRDIVPEFLLMLHGVIDSPDIPLNVSRSALQADREVKRITGYITRKVADKLNDIFKENRPDFESKWSDIGVFIKYGILSDDKFAEKAKSFALLTNIDGKNFTLDEYNEHTKSNQTDKNGRLVYLYTHDAELHDAYIRQARSRNYDVLLMNSILDNHFMQHLEHTTEKLAFARVDADTMANLIPKDESLELVLSEDEKKRITDIFKEVVGKDNSVEIKALNPEEPPVQITRSEYIRRMREMQTVSGGQSFWADLPERMQVVVNGNHPLIAQKLTATDNAKAAATYLYRLALLSQGMLKGPELTDFVQESIQRL